MVILPDWMADAIKEDVDRLEELHNYFVNRRQCGITTADEIYMKDLFEVELEDDDGDV